MNTKNTKKIKFQKKNP